MRLSFIAVVLFLLCATHISVAATTDPIPPSSDTKSQLKSVLEKARLQAAGLPVETKPKEDAIVTYTAPPVPPAVTTPERAMPPTKKLAPLIRAPKMVKAAPVIIQPNDHLPPIAYRIEAWKVTKLKNADKKNLNDFCLVEAAFDNQSSVMIGQAADGRSTLGINYGLDMLQQEKPYTITISLDQQFEEDFIGYAENSRTLIAQLGRKASFFDTLATAQILRVSMRGVTSRFSMLDSDQALAALDRCLKDIGGQALPKKQAVTAGDMPIVENSKIEAAPLPTVQPIKKAAPKIALKEKTIPPVQTPTVPSIMWDAKKPPVIIPPPVATPIPVKAAPVRVLPEKKTEILWNNMSERPIIKEESLPEPLAVKSVVKKDATPMSKAFEKPIKQATVSKPLSLLDKLPPILPPAPKQQIATPPKPPVATPYDWVSPVKTLLQSANIKIASFVTTGTQARWTIPNTTTQGTVAWQKQLAALDASINIASDAEKQCKGTFDSQLGVPETYGTATLQMMESKCTHNSTTLLSAWLIIENKSGTFTWQIKDMVSKKAAVFSLREALFMQAKKI